MKPAAAPPAGSPQLAQEHAAAGMPPIEAGGQPWLPAYAWNGGVGGPDWAGLLPALFAGNPNPNPGDGGSTGAQAAAATVTAAAAGAGAGAGAASWAPPAAGLLCDAAGVFLPADVGVAWAPSPAWAAVASLGHGVSGSRPAAGGPPSFSAGPGPESSKSGPAAAPAVALNLNGSEGAWIGLQSALQQAAQHAALLGRSEVFLNIIQTMGMVDSESPVSAALRALPALPGAAAARPGAFGGGSVPSTPLGILSGDDVTVYPASSGRSDVKSEAPATRGNLDSGSGSAAGLRPVPDDGQPEPPERDSCWPRPAGPDPATGIHLAAAMDAVQQLATMRANKALQQRLRRQRLRDQVAETEARVDQLGRELASLQVEERAAPQLRLTAAALDISHAFMLDAQGPPVEQPARQLSSEMLESFRAVTEPLRLLYPDALAALRAVEKATQTACGRACAAPADHRRPRSATGSAGAGLGPGHEPASASAASRWDVLTRPTAGALNDTVIPPHVLSVLARLRAGYAVHMALTRRSMLPGAAVSDEDHDDLRAICADPSGGEAEHGYGRAWPQLTRALGDFEPLLTREDVDELMKLEDVGMAALGQIHARRLPAAQQLRALLDGAAGAGGLASLSDAARGAGFRELAPAAGLLAALEQTLLEEVELEATIKGVYSGHVPASLSVHFTVSVEGRFFSLWSAIASLREARDAGLLRFSSEKYVDAWRLLSMHLMGAPVGRHTAAESAAPTGHLGRRK